MTTLTTQNKTNFGVISQNRFYADLLSFLNNVDNNDLIKTKESKALKASNDFNATSRELSHFDNLKQRLNLFYSSFQVALKNSIKLEKVGIELKENTTTIHDFTKLIKDCCNLAQNNSLTVLYLQLLNDLKNDKNAAKQSGLNCYKKAIKAIKDKLRTLQNNFKFTTKEVTYIDPRKIDITKHIEDIKSGHIFLLNKPINKSDNSEQITEFLKENKVLELPFYNQSFKLGKQHFRSIAKYNTKKIISKLKKQGDRIEYTDKNGEKTVIDCNAFKPVFGYDFEGKYKEIVAFNNGLVKPLQVDNLPLQQLNNFKQSTVLFFEGKVDFKLLVDVIKSVKKPVKKPVKKTANKPVNKPVKKLDNNLFNLFRDNIGFYPTKLEQRFLNEKVLNDMILLEPEQNFLVELFKIECTILKETSIIKNEVEFKPYFQNQVQVTRKKTIVKDSNTTPRQFENKRVKTIKPRGKKGYHSNIARYNALKNKIDMRISSGTINNDLELYYSQVALKNYPYFLEFLNELIALKMPLKSFYDVYYNKKESFNVFLDWIENKKDKKISYDHYSEIIELLNFDIVQKIGFNPLKKIKQSNARYNQALDKMRTISTHIIKHRIIFNNACLEFDQALNKDLCLLVKKLSFVPTHQIKSVLIRELGFFSLEYRLSSSSGKYKEVFDCDHVKPLKTIEEFFRNIKMINYPRFKGLKFNSKWLKKSFINGLSQKR